MGQEEVSMSDVAFNLKFTSKGMEREAKKAERDVKKEKTKVKKAIQKGNIEGARIFAQNAIRKKNEALNMYRLSARLDAVSTRVETAMKMKSVTRSMVGVVRGMDMTLKSMNIDKISHVMDKFEKQFEDLDVRVGYMDNAMEKTSATTTPENEVNSLLSEVVDANNLEVSDELGKLIGSDKIAGKEEVEDQADELSARLAKLKNQ